VLLEALVNYNQMGWILVNIYILVVVAGDAKTK